ncbi:MAG: DUF559 domain-containing protein [Vulcanimicrobiota bacterium]
MILLYRVFWEGISVMRHTLKRNKHGFAPMAKTIWALWRRKLPWPEYDRPTSEARNTTGYDSRTRDKITARARYLGRKRDGEERALYFLLGKNGERNILRQCIVGRCVVNYALPWRNLLIDIDKKSDTGKKSQYIRREAWLRSLGFNVMRTTLEQASADISAIVKTVNRFPESDENKNRFNRSLRTAMRESYTHPRNHSS